MEPRPPRRRRHRLLEMDAILDAAVELVDRTGRLTMAELGTALGVSPSSLYHHVAGKTDVLTRVRDRLVAYFDVPLPGPVDWSEQVIHWVSAIRSAISAHPRLVPLLVAQKVTSDAELRGYDHIVEALQRAGFPQRELIIWISVMDAFAVGSALDLSAPEDVWGTGVPDTTSLTAALRLAPRGPARVDAAFNLGLTALIDGMRAHLARPVDTARRPSH